MKGMRRSNVLRTILECLDFAKGYALPEEALRPQVEALLRPPPAEEEWAEAIDWLETNDLVAQIPSDLDPDLKQWSITERGRVRLKTL